MTRFIATISDKELLDKCHECVKIIRAAKDLQSAKANKNASILLEELDMEKNREESKKAAAARRRERKKKKKLEKKEERRKLYEENRKPESDDDDEDDDDGDVDVDPAAEASKAERLGSASPVADREEGDSGIDANSQGSCSSNDVKAKEPPTNKRKDKKKKKTADKLSDTSPPQPQEGKEKTSDRRVADIEDKIRLEVPKSVPEITRHPAEREDFEATGNETYVPASRPRKNNTAHQNHHEPESVSVKTFTTSPKGAGKREEGWKEVVRSFPYRSKKVSVPLNAISRVIGRAGSNINAIRAATGAHIEVDKQSKGQGERTITIKGSADATKQAHNLIAVLIKDPDVDIVQMLPKPGKPGQLTAVAVSKTKTAAISKASGPIPAVILPPKPPAMAPPAVKTTQARVSQVTLSLAQTKIAPNRILTAGEGKRGVVGSTKTTMSYTSVIMAPGRVSKPVPAAAPAPIGSITPLVKPRSAIGPITPPAPPTTAPQTSQVSPPQPMPPSPKHHRPQPTSSAPPTMQQGPMAAKANVQPNAPNSQQPNQQQLNHSLLHEYSLFNNGFSKNNMWGREQEKQNFASVAATGAPCAKFLDEVPNQVDVSKAPGYRAHGGPGCSPVKPFSPYPQDPNTCLQSPRGGEAATHAQMSLLQPMQMELPQNVPVAPIGPHMFGVRAGFADPTPMYSSSDMSYQLPSPPPPIQMSRLNPRAPDFPFPKRGAQAVGPSGWPYGHGPTHGGDLVFPPTQPSVSELLSFESALNNSPSMSPHSPIQQQLPSGEMKMEDRKMQRPIGTERHNFKIAGHNGYDQMDPSWLANYRPSASTTYRNLHDDLTLLDHSYQGAMNEQFHNGTALAQQIMLAQQQVPLHIPPMAALDPTKLENWEMDKHVAFTEGWTNAKWTH